MVPFIKGEGEMRHVVDGAASFLAAIVTFAICFFPCWFTYLAVESGVAPSWGWLVIAVLCVIGLIPTVAFLRKAVLGIAPTRERRR